MSDKELLQMESGQDFIDMAALNDTGDHKKYTGVDAPWSGVAGVDVEVRPNGILTGGVVTPAASAADNAVDISAATAYVAGEKVAIPGRTDVVIARAADTDTHIINSIVIAAGAFAAVSGADATAFSEVRGGDGGPAFVAVDAIEVGQVRVSSKGDAPVAESEIKQVPRLHRELALDPVPATDYAAGAVTFSVPLPAIHVGGVTKKVFASYGLPLFADLENVKDVTVPEESHSASSSEYYDGVTVAVSTSLGQGGFTQRVRDGITDPVVKAKGEKRWFRFFPDRNRGPHVMMQGVVGINRTWPTGGGNREAAVTVTCEKKASEIEA